MEFIISLASKTIKAFTNYKDAAEFCNGYLLDNNEKKDCDITIRILPEDILLENNLIHLGTHDNVRVHYSPEHLETLHLFRRICDIMPEYNCFMLHGAVVALDGKGYMFTAPSGIGKTTRIKLWMNEYPESVIVNGDKPLIQVSDERAFAWGTPLCGKEGWNTNMKVPLKEIFLLERAGDNETDTVKKMNFADAFIPLLKQAYQPKDRIAFQKTLHLLKALEGKVEIYRFRSHPTREAIRMAYEATGSDETGK